MDLTFRIVLSKKLADGYGAKASEETTRCAYGREVKSQRANSLTAATSSTAPICFRGCEFKFEQLRRRNSRRYNFTKSGKTKGRAAGGGRKSTLRSELGKLMRAARIFRRYALYGSSVSAQTRGTTGGRF